MCLKRGLNVLLTVLFVYLLLPLTVSSEEINTNDTLCGPKALQAICNEFDVSSTIDELAYYSWYDSLAGTTMYGLLNASKKLGLPGVPLKLDYDKLRSFQCPTIVFVQGNHFSVVWKVNKDNVIIQNWPESKKTISKHDFALLWTGEAIVYSKKIYKQMASELDQIINPPSRPRILFPVTHIHKGTVTEGTSLSHVFSYVNTGTESLTINTRSSCSCSSAILSSRVLAPGEKGKIEVTFNTSERRGLHENGVYIRSNDPNEKDWTLLSISAFVESPIIAIPNRLAFGKVLSGVTTTKEFTVQSPVDTSFSITSILAPKGFSVKPKSTYSDETDYYFTFSVTLSPQEELGKLHEEIKLIDEKNHIELSIPVDSEIVGPMEAIPMLVNLGELTSEQSFDKQFIIKSINSSVVYSNIQSNCSISGITIEKVVLDKKEGSLNEWNVRLSGYANGSTKIIDGHVDFYSETNKKILVVPVYGIVND